MAKEQPTMSELLQRKQHHEHKATVYRGRYIEHWRLAREFSKQLDALAEEVRKKERAA